MATAVRRGRCLPAHRPSVQLPLRLKRSVPCVEAGALPSNPTIFCPLQFHSRKPVRRGLEGQQRRCRGHKMTLALYTWATPNGHKPQIMLEELGVPYEIRAVNIFKGEQLTEEFRLINPNRRIPVLVDSSVAGEPPVRVFESGAILLYL